MRFRDQVRSIGTAPHSERVSLEILAPQGLSSVALELLVKDLKKKVLSHDMYIGNKDLFTADDALIIECLDPSVIWSAWPLCAEAIFLSRDKVLIRLEVSTDSWVQLLGGLCKEGKHNIISKVRWKSSRFGGRPSALSIATSSSLAAARRRHSKGGQVDQNTDFLTEIRVNGEPGMQDKLAIDTLIGHLMTHTGLDLKPHTGGSIFLPGTWKHLASRLLLAEHDYIWKQRRMSRRCMPLSMDRSCKSVQISLLSPYTTMS